MAAPTLTYGSVVLNMPTEDDAGAIDACHDADWCWAFWKERKPTMQWVLEDIRSAQFHWRRRSRFQMFAIRLSADGPLIGVLRIHPSAREPKGTARLDIEIAPEHRHAGVGQAAIEAAIRHVFATLGYVIAEAEIRPGNDASKRLVERCGFRFLENRKVPWSSGGTDAYQLRIHWWEWRQSGRT